MKRVLVVNPNSTHAMTAALEEQFATLRHRFPASVLFDFYTAPPDAPKAIEGSVESVHSASVVYADLTGATPEGRFLRADGTAVVGLSVYDAVLVACYSDHPLINMLREHFITDRKPVLGIMQASLLHALAIGCRRISVVTTAKRWEPLLHAGILATGVSPGFLASGSCCTFPGVLSTGLGVLEMESKPREEVVARVAAAAVAMVREAGADAICLGCAGMVGLKEGVEDALGGAGMSGVAVIDSVLAGLHFASGLAWVH
ncbi:hydantoin racemase family [Zopfochytrium polystomum]|nr:hydantoin racemase family [Zopfochytrium polystomum]